MKTQRLLNAAAAAFLVMSAPAHAICWIDDVRRTDEGLAIYFDPKAGVEVTVGTNDRPREWKRFSVGGADFVEVRESYVLGIRAAHHSACEGLVLRQNGVLGVSLSASDHLPGLAAQSVQQFLPGR